MSVTASGMCENLLWLLSITQLLPTSCRLVDIERDHGVANNEKLEGHFLTENPLIAYREQMNDPKGFLERLREQLASCVTSGVS